MVATGPAASVSNVTLLGLGATARSAKTQMYSANAPVFPPNTSSPVFRLVTFLPTASMVPDESTPTRVSLGLRSPDIGRNANGPVIVRSSGLTATARTFTRTWVSLGIGFWTALSASTSGEPYSQWTIAFIGFVGPLALRKHSLVDSQ